MFRGGALRFKVSSSEKIGLFAEKKKLNFSALGNTISKAHHFISCCN